MKRGTARFIWLFIGIITAVGTRSSIIAKYTSTKSERSFTKQAGKYRFTVALFYKEDRETRRDRELRHKIRRFKEILKSVSTRDAYEDADMQFIAVNVASRRAQDLAIDFQIGDQPAIILFEDGAPYKKNNNIIRQNGFLTREQLVTLIDNTWGDKIEQAIKQKVQRERQRRRERRYYSGGPSVSFGIGFGGGYGYPYWGGYPYYGWGYRPYWGYPGYYWYW